MERYLFFNIYSSHVIHYKDFVSCPPKEKLAFQSYSLLQNSSFELKSILHNSLYCFTSNLQHQIALVCVFNKETLSQEEALQLTDSIMKLFLQQFGHKLGSKLMNSFFKPFRRSLRTFFENWIYNYIESLSQSLNINFLSLIILEKRFQESERRSTDNLSIISPGSSFNTEMSSIDRPSKNVKKKFPLSSLNGKQTSYLLLSFNQNTRIEDQFVEDLSLLVLEACQIFQVQDDYLDSLTLSFKNAPLHIVKKFHLAIAYSGQNPLSTEILDTLYFWSLVLD